MNIGFISTWFERGAAYVTKSYLEALNNYDNNVFVYARGGEKFAIGDPNWDFPYVTWGLKLNGTKINHKHFKKWIIENKIEVLFFNEQHEFDVIAYIKKNFVDIKIGAYIDYYKEDTVKDFWLYDFLICNTKRHYSVFKDHPQCFYIPWGTDIELFKPNNISNNDKVTFFHSVGLSKRKGTDILFKAYIDGGLYKEANLVIHTQLNLYENFSINAEDIQRYNIKVIEETVTAPGLYHLGDVYVYPSTLDGLGLTIYEALACGSPVITTNNAPMNEVVNKSTGYLVEVEKTFSRSNGYYWPMAICDKISLINGMRFYIEKKNDLQKYKDVARKYAVSELNWKDRFVQINRVFKEAYIRESNIDYDSYLKEAKRKKLTRVIKAIYEATPNRIEHYLRSVVSKQ